MSLHRWILVVIVLAAFGLRVFQLSDIPPGFHFDEGFYGLDAVAVLNGNIQPYYPANGGREALWMVISAPFIALLGYDPLAMRLPSAFSGVLTVAAAYALGRRMFLSSHGDWARWIGLAFAGLTAGAFVLILQNRVGLRATLYPLFLALSGIAFMRAYEGGTLMRWGVAGLVVGLTHYTYSGSRALLAVFPGYVVIDLILNRRWSVLTSRRLGPAVFMFAFLVTLSPLVTYAVTHTAEFTRRAEALSPLNEDKATEPPLQRITNAFVGTLPAFFIRGDERIFRNFPGKPFVEPFLAPFWIAGVGIALWRALRRGPPGYGLMLWWIFLMTAANALPLGLVPHFYHLSGVLPVVFLPTALGLVEAARYLAGRKAPAVALALAIAVLVAVSGGIAGYQYFEVWAKYPQTLYEFDGDIVDMVNAMNDGGDEPGRVYVLALSRLYANEYTHGTIDFLYRGKAPFAYMRVDEATVAQQLSRLVGTNTSVVVFQRSQERDLPPDNNGILDWLLTRQGEKTGDEFRRGFRMTTYEVNSPLLPDLTPGGMRPVANQPAAPIRLTQFGAGVDPDRTAVWARATWQAVEKPTTNVKATIRLVDPSGRVIGQSDRDLWRSPEFDATSFWDVGDSDSTNHVILLPDLAPAGTYTLRGFLYDASNGRPLTDEFLLGTVQIGPA